MNKYPSYKDSNVDYLREIPASWSVSKLKNVLSERKENNRGRKTENILSVIKDKGVINYEEKGDIGNKKSDDIERYKIVHVGDIVLNSMNVIIGSVGISKEFGALSPVYYVLNSSDETKYHNRFYGYLFKEKTFQKGLKRLGNGILEHRLRIPIELLQQELVPVPSIEEQIQISDFLDLKISQIDKLISKKQELIDNLKGYQQSLITETVTRGLNPNVKMKDSGVEWIGKIPDHWEIKKLKYVKDAPMLYGATESGEPIQDGQPRYIRITDLTLDGQLKDEDVKGLEMRKAKPYLLKDGDILFARSGATVGKTFIYKEEYGPCCFAGYLIKFSPKRSKVIPEFLYYFTKSGIYHTQVDEATTQATIQNVSAEKYLNFVTVLPPINEQNEIVDFLNKKISEIDELVLKIQEQIKILQKYQQSLIYEAVTGKIDVRNYNGSELEVKL